MAILTRHSDRLTSVARPLVLAVLIAVAAGVPLSAQEAAPVWARGLDELMSLEVSSVSKKDQRVADTSAAVFVLTRDEIRRSGLRSVPELLRLVPGLDVAQVDASTWAISSRGMNGRFANKLLVMIDGRSVYTPYFAGVFWDAVDVPVQTIERIEVIRGPGASVWGANAMNGVINIITIAAITQRETTAAVTGGSDATLGLLLHQGRLGARVAYRVFADASGIDALETPARRDGHDAWSQHRAGLAMHATLNARDALDVGIRASSTTAGAQLDTGTSAGAPLFTDTTGDSWMSSLRWTRQLARGGELRIEAFADEWQRRNELDHRRHTADVALQHHVGRVGRHDLIWGVDAAVTHERTVGALPNFVMQPETFAHHLVSAFAQDDVQVFSPAVHVVLGAKLENRETLGWGLQPTARLNWRVSARQDVWVAVSHALRAPDRVERALRFNSVIALPDSTSVSITVHPNASVAAEHMTSYEAGFRRTLAGQLTLDTTAFYSRYSDLIVVVPESVAVIGDVAPLILIDAQYRNGAAAETLGVEHLVTYAPLSRVKLTGGYTLLASRVSAPDATLIASLNRGSALDLAAPEHQGQLRASVTLPHSVDVDGTLFAVGALKNTVVPAYTRTDARLAWRPLARVELAAVGQNLFDASHLEFVDTTKPGQMHFVPRRFFGNVTWRF